MSKPYPWFYAVNDRPVAIVPLPGGGVDCLVYEHATGNLVPDRSYFAHVTPGSGKDVDAFTADQFARLLADRRAGLVCAWAERLCEARSGAEADVAAALGVRLDPPPLAATRLRVRGGDIPLVELELGEPLVLGDLERRLGAGNRLPRVDWDRPHVVAFTVARAGAPFRCVALASSDEEPRAEGPVTRVTLRLDAATS